MKYVIDGWNVAPFDTFEEAREACIAYAQTRVDSFETKLFGAKRALERCMEMKESDFTVTITAP